MRTLPELLGSNTHGRQSHLITLDQHLHATTVYLKDNFWASFKALQLFFFPCVAFAEE
jgi:hypothetical protein